MNIGAQMRRHIYVLLGTHGQTLILRREIKGAYDPDTGAPSSSTTDDEDCTVVLSNYGVEEIDGQSILRGDRKALLSPFHDGASLVKTPQPGDLIVGEGSTVKVVSVQTVKSGSTVVGYKCQVRE